MKPIVLIGSMGSGKSTVGKCLARTLSMPFIDLDTEIEQCKEMSVAEIFARYGEPYFRSIEIELFAELIAEHKKLVLATGGGTPMSPQFWQHADHFHSVFLDVAFAELVRRLAPERTHRPLLANASDWESEVQKLIQTRRPSYEKAHVQLKILTEQSENHIVKQIIEHLKVV